VRVSAATTELATQNELLRRQALALEHASRPSRVPGQHLTRVSHAAQRHPRLHVDAAAEHAGTMNPSIASGHKIDLEQPNLAASSTTCSTSLRIEADQIVVDLTTFAVSRS
jgi:hypothetical protein